MNVCHFRALTMALVWTSLTTSRATVPQGSLGIPVKSTSTTASLTHVKTMPLVLMASINVHVNVLQNSMVMTATKCEMLVTQILVVIMEIVRLLAMLTIVPVA